MYDTTRNVCTEMNNFHVRIVRFGDVVSNNVEIALYSKGICEKVYTRMSYLYIVYGWFHILVLFEQNSMSVYRKDRYGVR